MVGMIRVDEDRLAELSNLLKDIAGYAVCFERFDPQFKAVRRLVESFGCGGASVLAVANSIISYQLSTRGEVYWEEFSKWVTSRSGRSFYESHVEFLESTSFNKARLASKLVRLRRFYSSNIAGKLEREPLKYCLDLPALVAELASLLGGSPEDKTIVFAGKMMRYVCLACGSDTAGDIPIPLDRRNALLLVSSCIVRGCEGRVEECVSELMTKRRRLGLELMRELCKRAGVECVKLDALTWRLMGALRSETPVEEVEAGLGGCFEAGKAELLKRIYLELSKCLSR
jgi:DNA-(apurinic or apyrimidinic site) lyase